jgi:glycosyltransferase involved in cell wall biosynthesis
MNTPLKLSLLIPTYNRHDIICETVEKYLAQDYADFEIIVIDQTREDSGRVDDFFKKREDRKVQRIRIEEIGLPNARNVGIRAAKGDIIVFIDDDTEPENKSFLKQHAANYADPEVAGVAGRIIDRRYKEENDPNRIQKLTRWGTVQVGKNGTVRTEIDILSGGNMSFRREEALVTSLFDTELLGSAAGEEITFSLELRRKSRKKFVFDPRSAIIHYALTQGGCENRSVSPLVRQFYRFSNLTITFLKNRDFIKPFFYFIGRMGAIIRLCFSLKSIKPVYYLNKAMYLGYKIYKKKEIDRERLNLWLGKI